MPPIDAREFAVWIARRLREHGHLAYFAGGCVRDQLLGLQPTDYDLATDARPDRIKSLFRSAIGVGESFGVVLVRRGDLVVEVATFRSDGTYSDGRRPDSVSFGDEEADAARRDFTINAIFQDPVDETIIDYFDGRSDLEARILRAVGDPDQRLNEDRLRVLRAIRFAARFELSIEAATSDAITRHASRLEGVSRERVGQELRKMLSNPERRIAARLLEDFELDREVLGSVRTRPDVFELIERMPEESCDPMDALAAWLLDRVGVSALDSSGPLRNRLMLSNQETKRLERVLELFFELLERWSALVVAPRKRLAADPLFASALELIRGRDPKLARMIDTDLEELARTGIAPTPFVDGDDLVEAGLTPGPLFRTILDGVYDAQLEQRVGDQAAALELALRLATELDRETTP